MKLAPPETSTCASCGAASEETLNGDLGCMVCLLRVGLSDAVDHIEDESSPPDQFGPYIIERHEDGSAYELGRGAMGVTYRAIDTSLQRSVALKLIKTDLAGRSTEARERFMREARAAAALRHPNVATVYHFGIREETGQCFYAMELVEGETLDARVRRTGPLDVPTTVEIAQQIASALAAAEKRRLVHRDLKPANIMIATAEGPDGVEELSHIQIKVIDFGVAKALTEQTDPRVLTHNGLVGTPAFASPEQFTNAPVDVRSDIYSLGTTLWYLLTGKIPFAERTPNKLSEARATPPIEQLTAVHVPARLVSLLCRMLAIEPAARPSVRDLFASLEEVRGHISKRGRHLRLFGIAAALMAAGAATFLVFRLLHLPAVERDEARTKSIAVLPFEDLSADRTKEFFTNGIHEDVLVSLSKITDLKVISRNSVMQYRGVGRDLREIGRALGVNAVLEGSVRRDGKRARINVQLIKAADGAQIWAENYERDISDAFAIQSEVALRIASALKANLSSFETARLQQAPTKNSEAYLRFIEAKNLYEDYRKLQPDLDKAERLYEEAIALDPGFALAYARLSQLENMYYENYDKTPARREKSRAAAREALRLEPDLPEGHMALGLDLWRPNASIGEIDYEKTRAEFALAQRGLPNDAEICGLIGQVERHQGKWAESTEHLKRAVSLDPNSVERWHRLFFNYELMRNYPAAEEALEHTIALAPIEDRWTYLWHRAFLHIFSKGDLSELERVSDPSPEDPRPHTEERSGFKIYLRKYPEAEKIVLSDKRETFSWGGLNGAPKSLVLGRIYFYMKDQAKARAAFESARATLERSVAAKPRDSDQRMFLAEAYARLGQKRGGDSRSQTRDGNYPGKQGRLLWRWRAGGTGERLCHGW